MLTRALCRQLNAGIPAFPHPNYVEGEAGLAQHPPPFDLHAIAASSINIRDNLLSPPPGHWLRHSDSQDESLPDEEEGKG
jgi:hypothetical protein